MFRDVIRNLPTHDRKANFCQIMIVKYTQERVSQ